MDFYYFKGSLTGDFQLQVFFHESWIQEIKISHFGTKVWDFDVLDFNDLYRLGDLKAEIKFLHFLQMGEILAIFLATACAVYASKVLPYAALPYRLR